MTVSLTKTFAVGDKIVFTDRNGSNIPEGFNPGDVVTVKGIVPDGSSNGDTYTLVEDETGADWNHSWFKRPDRVILASKPLSATSRPKPGTKIVFSDRHGSHGGYKPGDIVTVKSTSKRHPTGYVINLDVSNDDRVSKGWGFEWFDSLAEGQPVDKPVIIAATLKHDTAKVYAGRARSSKLLEPEHNDILEAASKGQEVDVVAFRKAVTASFSAAATRYGQSPKRREATKELRHLAYWADAIIDQHIQGLPIYEAGPRSAKIRDLQAENSDLKARVVDHEKSLRAKAGESEALALAARDVANAKGEIDRLTEFLQETQAAHRAAVEARDTVTVDAAKRVEDAERERDTLASVLLYVTSLAPSDVQARTIGYWEGLEDQA